MTESKEKEVNLTTTDHINNLKEIEKKFRALGPCFSNDCRKMRRAITAVESMHEVIKRFRRISKRMD